MQQRKFLATTILCLGSVVFSLNADADLPPIKIGVIGPVTGKSSEALGQSIIGGARVFVADTNQMGGIMGRRVELVERDDVAKPELGAALVKEMIEKDGVSAVVGVGNTGVAMEVGKVIQQLHVPLIVTGATGAAVTKTYGPPAVADSYVFRTSASDALQPIVILNDVIDRRKLTRIAFIHDESPYGMFGKQSVLGELERRNIKPVDVESYKVGDIDMTAQMQKIRESGAQVVVIYGLGADCAAVAKSAEKIHYKIPMVGSWNMSHQPFSDLAGDAAEGARMSVTYIDDEFNPTSVEFGIAYRKLNNVERIPSPATAAQTYDALRLIALAMHQANSTDPVQVKHALENLRQHTSSTVMSRYYLPFSTWDHEAVSLNMLFMGEVRKGRVVYAYKEDADNGMIKRVKKGQAEAKM